MAGDKLQLLQWPVDKSCPLLSNILVTYTVEPILSNLVLVIQLVGWSIEIGILENRGMEGGIEHGHLGYAGTVFFTGHYTL